MSIDGIKLSITSVELKATCEARVKYHTMRAEHWLERVKKLEPTIKEIEDAEEEDGEVATGQMKYSSNGGAENAQRGLDEMRRRVKHHRDRATVFRFMSEHVIPNDTYILTENDLQKLEVIKPNRY